MKRDDALIPLSHEHHRALELALRLRRATSADAGSIAEAAKDFWRAEGHEHFRQEEDVLLPAFARHVPAADPDIVRVLVEHVELRRRFADVEAGTGSDPAELNALGELLAGHVRHEERTLFDRIESALVPAELAAVGSALHAS
jgi:hemerythrin-like domain-containing protein